MKNELLPKPDNGGELPKHPELVSIKIGNSETGEMHELNLHEELNVIDKERNN